MGLSIQTTDGSPSAIRPLAPGKKRSRKFGNLTTLKHKLYTLFLKEHPAIKEFLTQLVDFSSLSEFDSEIIDSENLPQIKALRNSHLRLFINFHRVNDMRWLNQYFLAVHQHMSRGGLFVGMGETLEIHKSKFFQRHTGFFGTFLYLCHFLYARIMPKLPVLKQIYFTLSQGQNRALSKAEILGRLCYCGFKIVAVKETEDNFYFIARKEQAPSTCANPSYGFVINLRRIGQDGKTIFIKKFRTMHPYSEFLQQYVFEQNNLELNGKFRDDFRITSWGRFMRKYWLDELPQLINLLKRDVNLVGVRALSRHYFSLYPGDLQRLRVQFKPGLIPPYYVDLPNSFEEIVESERNYLQHKQNRQFVTDNIYMAKALYNIFVRQARSL